LHHGAVRCRREAAQQRALLWRDLVADVAHGGDPAVTSRTDRDMAHALYHSGP
jgi:hypothetical protein